MQELSEDLQDLLDKYLRGELGPDEQAQWQAVSGQPAVQAALAFHQDLMQALRPAGREALRTELAALDREDAPPAARIRHLRPALWAAALAAAVVILLAVWLGRRGQTPGSAALFATHFTPYPNTLARIPRDEADLRSPIELAMYAYERGDYARAREVLEGMATAATRRDLRFYLGVSALASGDTLAARLALAPLRDTPDQPFGPEAAWYLALTRLRADQPDQARDLLRSIAATADHPYQASAQALLNAL
ncbi:MAG: hypothetical protein OHK0039_45470 [Bacteroidia bacterium]